MVNKKPVDEVILNDLKEIDQKIKIIVSGKIIEAKRNTEKGYDFGEFTVKQMLEEDNDEIKEKRVSIVYKNEYLLAYN